MGDARKCRIAVLCSGGGGNLRFLHAAIERHWLGNAEIVNVIADRQCVANDFAAVAGIPNEIVDFSDAGQSSLLAALQRSTPDLIITTVHKILKPPVINAWRGRLLNLHYSLLPAFGGTIGSTPLKGAIEYGARFTGVTAHNVDEQLDGGTPIVQGVIPIRAPEIDFDALMNLVFRCGCVALLTAVQIRMGIRVSDTERALTLLGRVCLFNAAPALSEKVFADESFWATLAGTTHQRQP